MCRAGSFSAALSHSGDLYIWGTGVFGKHELPYKFKYGTIAPIVDIKISRKDFALLATSDGQIYSWGTNDSGQLGHGDFKARSNP